MYKCMHVCTYVCTYVCMYECMYVHIYIYMSISTTKNKIHTDTYRLAHPHTQTKHMRIYIYIYVICKKAHVCIRKTYLRVCTPTCIHSESTLSKCVSVQTQIRLQPRGNGHDNTSLLQTCLFDGLREVKDVTPLTGGP